MAPGDVSHARHGTRRRQKLIFHPNIVRIFWFTLNYDLKQDFSLSLSGSHSFSGSQNIILRSREHFSLFSGLGDIIPVMGNPPGACGA